MNELSSRKKTGAAEVATDLRQAIQLENLTFNERIPSERELSETYKVSRGTIRDALLRLEREGLVEIRPGSGTYVTFSNKNDGTQIIRNARPLELIDTRFALEPHICRLAVLNAQPDDFDKLDDLLKQMEDQTDAPKKFADLDTQFHATLVESTGNSLLIWIISQINAVRGHDQWNEMRRITLHPDIIAVYNTQHRNIVDAIKNRDSERAANTMKLHLETARDSLMRSAAA